MITTWCADDRRAWREWILCGTHAVGIMGVLLGWLFGWLFGKFNWIVVGCGWRLRGGHQSRRLPRCRRAADRAATAQDGPSAKWSSVVSIAEHRWFLAMGARGACRNAARTTDVPPLMRRLHAWNESLYIMSWNVLAEEGFSHPKLIITSEYIDFQRHTSITPTWMLRRRSIAHAVGLASV